MAGESQNESFFNTKKQKDRKTQDGDLRAVFKTLSRERGKAKRESSTKTVKEGGFLS